MNQKRKPLNDAMFETESPEAIKRLDEIERRLQATRPQPPRVDVANLQRLADDDAGDAAAVSPAERRPRRSASRRRRRIGGRLLLIVGSWVCGAAVGSAVMFALMSHVGGSGDTAHNETALKDDVARIDEETPDAIAHNRTPALVGEPESDLPSVPPAVETAVSRVRNASMLAAVLNPLGPADSTYLADGPTLQAGMYLSRHAERSMWPFAVAVEKEQEVVPDAERRRAERRTESRPYAEPEPAVTARELMREFLGEASGAVL